MKPSSPTVIIKNNSAYTLLADLGNKSARTIVNQLTSYTWNITAEIFLAASQVSIQVKGNSTQEFQTMTAALRTANAQGVVNALNGLAIGSFATLMVDGITTIVTYNDTLIFGVLTVADPSAIEVTTIVELLQTAASYALRANGNVINSVSAMATDSYDFEAITGTLLAIHIETNMPSPIILEVLVVKNTLSGPQTVINENVSSVQIYDTSFITEADALSYEITISTLFPP